MIQRNRMHIEAERRARPELRGASPAGGEIAAIRAIAAADGLEPALAVLHMLDRAPRASQAAMLPILRDALRSGRTDADAAHIYAAACAVRLAG